MKLDITILSNPYTNLMNISNISYMIKIVEENLIHEINELK